ncbi:hypothetical protein HYPSUDRAFT_202448 [Hypholoma sublateritium FD-334 SS-4]|uniref:Uncharacterized protein n=1 Tax=Hypholoma sublateritium (strain FD-334 SS-4) TaxID=945553 RepID=A0A0D2MF74_HYPSF|nr:hypothetical protein HYPSUDRAFT_202448 [Hypholoma sublateritium FD-334 SS-4]
MVPAVSPTILRILLHSTHYLAHCRYPAISLGPKPAFHPLALSFDAPTSPYNRPQRADVRRPHSIMTGRAAHGCRHESVGDEAPPPPPHTHTLEYIKFQLEHITLKVQHTPPTYCLPFQA